MKIKSCLLFSLLLQASIQQVIAQTPVVNGTVKDTKGAAIPSATIRITGTNTGTNSDSLGAFSLHAAADASLSVSAIGYRDTTFALHNQLTIAIVLAEQSKSLGEVVVAHASQGNDLQGLNQVVNDQIIANALEDYVRGENISYGEKVTSGLQIGDKGGGGFHTITTFGTGNTVNYGAMIPNFSHKEETQGSRYLFDTWVNGMVVSPLDSVVNNPGYLYNYDKITGDLLMTSDKKTAVIVDRPQIRSFALKGADTGYVFERVPAVTDNDFLRLVETGKRYRAYCSLKTKLVKADHVSNGYTESGNAYDEYVNSGVYYFLDTKTNRSTKFDLKKKSIIEALPQESAKVNAFITAHKHDDINEEFIRGLIKAINQ